MKELTKKETENDFYIHFSDNTTAKFPHLTLISHMIQSVAREVAHLSTKILKINTMVKKSPIKQNHIFSSKTTCSRKI